MGPVAERAEAGEMIGMEVRIDGLDQSEVEFVHELEVPVDLLQHRIDDQRLASAPAGQKIGVGSRDAVEELAEDHRLPRRFGDSESPGDAADNINMPSPRKKGAGSPCYSS